MAKKKNEHVSVSFHYLAKEDHSKTPVLVTPFTLTDFNKLFEAIKNKPELDISDEKVADTYRYKQDAPLEECIRINDRTIFGIFRSSYWGHAYKNSLLGQISADSLNMRPFHFVLYLSESGRIYLGSQYLGHFGGYTTLKNTILNLLKCTNTVHSHSFRLNNQYYKNSSPKEIRFSFSNKSSSITGGNLFGQSGMIAFRKSDNPEFETKVKTSILSMIGSPKADIKKALAKLLNESHLIAVKDDDIVDCSILVQHLGNDKVINILEEGFFATRFPLTVTIKDDGHPEYNETKTAMLELLEKEIISKNEDI